MHKKLLLIIPIIIILAIPVAIFAKFQIDCNNQFNAAKKDRQSAIGAFDKIALLGENPPQKTQLVRTGDCVDSRPGIAAHKNYLQEENGGEAVDSIRTGLKNAGYTITKQDF